MTQESPARHSAAPAAPIAGTGDIDPELIALSRPRPTVTMITAAAAVIVAVFLLWRTNADRAFVWHGNTVVAMASPAVAAGAPLEATVRLESRATLDYGAAVRAKSSRTDRGVRLAPVGGTNLALWVAVDGHAWAPPALEEQTAPAGATAKPVPQQPAYQGRLRAVRDTRFAAQLAALVQTPQPVAVSAQALRAALRDRAPAITSITGDTIAMPAPTTRVEFEVPNPKAVMLSCVLVAKHPTAAAWRAQLQQTLGVDVGDAIAETAYGVTFRLTTFPAAAPDLATLRQALLGAGLQWTVTAAPEIVRHTLTLADVAAGGESVRISDTSQLAWSDVDVVALWVARAVPANARVIFTNETAQMYWYITPLVVVSALLAVLFAWAFVRAWRYERQESRAQELLRQLQGNA